MALKVRWERADQRRHLSVTAPLLVEIGGREYRATRWSLGHVELDAEAASALPPIGSEIQARLTLPFQGFDIGFPVTGRVVPPAHDDAFAIELVEVGERERALMRHFIEELLRGSMVPVEDTIQRLDVPVTPVSLEPERAHRGLVGGAGRAARAGLMTLLYAGLGLAVFGYLGYLGHARLFHIDTANAVISSPIEVATSQAEGHVIWTEARPGQRIAAGDVVLQLYDNDLEKEIELAEIAVREREARLQYLLARAAASLTTLQSTAAAGATKLTQAQLEVEALAARLQAAEHELKRARAVPAPEQRLRIAEARRKVVAQQKALEGKKVEVAGRADAASKAAGLPNSAGRNLIDETNALEAQIEFARHEVEFTRERLDILIGHRRRLAVRAPFEGTLVELPHADRASVRKGDPVARFERQAVPQVSAWLSQSEVMHVGIGDRARLHMPALGESLLARIVEIDRSNGALTEPARGAGQLPAWRGQVEHPARVVLAIEHAETLNVDRYRTGLPVVVRFDRRWASGGAIRLKERLAAGLSAMRPQAEPR